MGSMWRASPVPLLPLLLVALGGASALNITRLLESAPEFTTFNLFLNRTGVAAEVNRRQTITVLALDNGAMGAVSGLEEQVAADVLRLHVVLDYYDLEKLHNMRRHTTILTTLFQSTGRAAGMGFLNATVLPGGEIRMGSSAPHEPLSARVVGMVLTRPYNISVIQVDSPIVPQGLDGFTHPVPPPPPPPPPSPPRAPAPTPAEPPTDDDAPAEAPTDDDAPAAPAPAEDDVAPAADEPTSPSPSPEADEDEYEDESAGWRAAAGGSTVGTAVMAALVALM